MDLIEELAHRAVPFAASWPVVQQRPYLMFSYSLEEISLINTSSGPSEYTHSGSTHLARGFAASEAHFLDSESSTSPSVVHITWDPSHLVAGLVMGAQRSKGMLSSTRTLFCI